MSLFDEREKAFEAQFRNQQELEFKVMVRRDKLFGMWAAEQAGLSGDEEQKFTRSVIEAEVASHEVLHKVQNDLAALGKVVPETELAAKLHEFHELAREQVYREAGVVAP